MSDLFIHYAGAGAKRREKVWLASGQTAASGAEITSTDADGARVQKRPAANSVVVGKETTGSRTRNSLYFISIRTFLAIIRESVDNGCYFLLLFDSLRSFCHNTSYDREIL
ncbi:MAG: hypothetical protein G01um101466_333, partial [Parcubacteria group bacterium Gr01-1014_66]